MRTLKLPGILAWSLSLQDGTYIRSFFFCFVGNILFGLNEKTLNKIFIHDEHDTDLGRATHIKSSPL